jgi:hypothetical protein
MSESYHNTQKLLACCKRPMSRRFSGSSRHLILPLILLLCIGRKPLLLQYVECSFYAHETCVAYGHLGTRMPSGRNGDTSLMSFCDWENPRGLVQLSVSSCQVCQVCATGPHGRAWSVATRPMDRSIWVHHGRTKCLTIRNSTSFLPSFCDSPIVGWSHPRSRASYRDGKASTHGL